MVRNIRLDLAILGMLASLAGCVHSDKCCQHDVGIPDPPLVLPVVPRGTIEGQIQKLPPIPLHEVGKPPDRPYRVLTPDVCRCLAAKTSDTGNMLDNAAASIQEKLDNKCLPPSQEKIRQAALKQDILHSAALEARNADSALTLNAYYRLFEDEGLVELQGQSIQVLAEAISKTQDMLSKGLKSPEDLESLKRQQLEMLADFHRLQLGIDALNAEVGRSISLEDRTCACKTRFWLADALHFRPDPPDCEKAVADGLANRAELYALQRMIDELDVRTLDMIRKVMTSFSPLLALADSKPACPMLAKLIVLLCGGGKLAEEVEEKRRQLMEHKAERMRVISSEIRQDVTTLCERARAIALSRERVVAFGLRVAEIEAKAAKGLANFGDVTNVKLDWLKARADVVKALVNWEREYVSLCMHQGILPQKCHEVLDGPPPPEAVTPAPPAVLPPVANQFSNRLSRELSMARKRSQ